LSRIHPIASALFHKKRGVGVPLVQPIQRATGFTATLLPRQSLRGAARSSPVSSFTASLLPREVLRGVAKTSLLSSFTASLLPREVLRGVAKTSLLSSFTASLLPREVLRGVAKTSLLSSFTASLTQKQGGSGCWSYQFNFADTDLKVGHYNGKR